MPFLAPLSPLTLLGLSALCVTPPTASLAPSIPDRSLAARTEDEVPSAALQWIGGDEHSYGTVIEGELIEHTFVLMSTGQVDLVLEEIEVNCACTTFEALRVDGAGQRSLYQAGAPLPVGDTLELAVRVDTTDKSGELMLNVRIKTNIPDKVYALAKLTLEVVKPFHSSPAVLALGELFPGQEAAGTVRISNIFAQPFRPELDLNKFAEWIGVELEPVDPDPDGLALAWDVHLSVAAGLPAKNNNSYPIRLRTTLPDKAQFATASSDGSMQFTFQVIAGVRVRDWIEFEPAQVQFGRLWAKRSYERSVTIKCNDEEFTLDVDPSDVSIQGYGKPFPWADNTTLEVHAIEGGDVQIKIKVSGLPQRMPEPFVGYLSIDIGHPDFERIEVPIAGQHR